MQQFEVAGFDAEGVTLISPFAAEFASSVDSLVPEGIADVVRVALTMVFSTLDGTAVPDALTVG